MANRNEIQRLVREEFEHRKFRAEEAADARKEELHRVIPETARIDRLLSMTALGIMDVASRGGDIDRAIGEMREENRRLRKERGDLLEKHGYPRDYSDVKYQCDKCSDTGFVGIDMCECRRRETVLRSVESSGIGGMIAKQSFENFELKYYQGDAYAAASHAKEVLSRFASDFRRHRGESYLLIGGTGLGKTHLSTATARRVIEGGGDVVYVTSHELMSRFERQRFGAGAPDDGETDDIFACDLLLIDDLGVELANQFTLSSLYNVINTRLNRGLSTVINTNLTSSELRGRYADRITSRLFGEYIPLLFSGNDIRAQKLTAHR